VVYDGRYFFQDRMRRDHFESRRLGILPKLRAAVPREAIATAYVDVIRILQEH
jgi:hypothetical protein